MLTPHGVDNFLKALGTPYKARVYVRGGLQPESYSCANGYPRLNDPDVANTNRGDNVMTWKYVVPRGTVWNGPATEVELFDDSGIVDKFPIPPLHASADYPTVLYLNLMLRRT